MELNAMNRRRLSFAPYDLSIYKSLLNHLSNDKKYVISNLENYRIQAKENKIHIILRHDVDTSDCIKKMGLLLEEDLKWGFRPSVYLRVDEEEYSLGDWKVFIEEYHLKGVPFGLHSVCYVNQNYLETFRHETKKFILKTGIVPKSFTLHGLGEYGMENRLQFIKTAKEVAIDNGYRVTDCSEDFISYDYVMHDSHWDMANQKRYIMKEFIRLPNFSKGKYYLILTHPCYWRNGSQVNV